MDFGARVYNPSLGRFLSMDKFSNKFPNNAPYLYAGNSPISGVDINGDSLYILAYAMGYANEAGMFFSSADTRRKDIEAQKGFNPERDKVVLVEVTDLALLKQQVKDVTSENAKQYGKTVEFGMWSHSGLDGPVGTIPTSQNSLGGGDDAYQMSVNGWSNINFNWFANGGDRCSFYGCNSAKDKSGLLENSYNFSSLLSIGYNMTKVTVFGQTTSSYPSQYTNAKIPSVDMVNDQYSDGTRTYMVGGKGGAAGFFSTEAFPMKGYQKGKEVKEAYQSGTKK